MVVVVPVIVAVGMTVLADAVVPTVGLARKTELLQEEKLFCDFRKVETMCHVSYRHSTIPVIVKLAFLARVPMYCVTLVFLAERKRLLQGPTLCWSCLGLLRLLGFQSDKLIRPVQRRKKRSGIDGAWALLRQKANFAGDKALSGLPVARTYYHPKPLNVRLQEDLQILVRRVQGS